MKFALVGRPNCGKSTLFNQVAGYKAETGNFHGTTVSITESKVRAGGQIFELVDLPGTYTLTGSNPAERVTKDYLDNNQVDVIINVVDSTFLPQSLELTLELLKYDVPILLAMNMMDEVVRYGMTIDGPSLGIELGLKTVPLIASKGRGVKSLFLEAIKLVGKPAEINARFSSFDDNPISRHKAASELAKKHTLQTDRQLSLRDRADDILLHPVWGHLTLALILFLFFQGVYGVGKLIEPPMLTFFESIIAQIEGYIGSENLLGVIVTGLLQGVMAGFAIVLPYLFPFLVGLGLLEDIGYLPRIAFLMDSLMHRIGLHGKAIVPFILGYGCNVPAIMSTRTLEQGRERFIAAALSTLVPCSARLVVVFGLVAFYMGPMWALGMYLLNLFVIALTGRILSKLLPETSPGMILEMPPYRIPTFKSVMNKAWFRVKEFMIEAWPLLIIGSGVMAILIFYDLAKYFDILVRPITWMFGLPEELGVPMIFGVLRKELSLVMLTQALGTADYGSVLTYNQMFTFTIFIIFFIPCVATMMMIKKELGTKQMYAITGLTFFIALVVGLISRLVGEFF